MTSDFLPLFRRHLFTWFEARLADGRSPFRRVEERPPLLGNDGPPDLVLWINRDSLMAGAVILIPEKTDPVALQQYARTAATLGLRQFVTWEALAVNLWLVNDGDISLCKNWQLPAAEKLTATDFAIAGDRLLQELKMSAITGSCPPPELPAEHFANLCLFNLHLMQPAIDEAARVAAQSPDEHPSTCTLAQAKGWLIIWRLLALLWHRRLPLGVAPERFEQALRYAVADLPVEQLSWLAATDEEVSLPATAATRCQHLAGRLSQLGWAENRERALATLDRLLAEVTRLYGVDQVTPDEEITDLLVNRLPAATGTPRVLIAPRPCLAGLTLLRTFAGGAGLPPTLAEEVTQVPHGWRPQRVDACLNETAPPVPAQRRRLLAALRRAWPYRRISLPGTTPAWVWQAFFLSGITAPDGELRLHLPAGWATAPGAELLWNMLCEQWALSGLHLNIDGVQILTLVAIDQAPATITVQSARESVTPSELPATDVPLPLIAGLAPPEAAVEATRTALRQSRNSIQEHIENRVFRDGLPRFPEDYLRRRDPVPLCSHHLPGPLRQDSSFFGFCRLLGPAGEILDVDSPVTAEALILAGRSGRRQVSLPDEPLQTAELINSYRSDLQRLWTDLLRECRRHLSRQQQVRNMARLIWQRHQLPPVESE